MFDSGKKIFFLKYSPNTDISQNQYSEKCNVGNVDLYLEYRGLNYTLVQVLEKVLNKIRNSTHNNDKYSK